MAEEKKDSKRETKAGMMKDFEDQTGSEPNEKTSENVSEDVPKISKEISEVRNDDIPLH